MSIFTDILSIFLQKEKSNTDIIIENAIQNRVQEILIPKTQTNEPVENIPQYTFDFTYDKFKQIIINKESKLWFDIMYPILPKYNINTKERVAGFLAQTGHESLDYKVLEENLNYSADRLRVIWPKRFPNITIAQRYHRNPQLIANYVYANRLGNGPQTSGDGWRFRGRGLIQCTGRFNYTKCSQFLYKNDKLLENPDILLTKEGALLSACWYWTTNDLNKFCDKKDILGMTKRINGGTVGLSDRQSRFNKALKVL